METEDTSTCAKQETVKQSNDDVILLEYEAELKERDQDENEESYFTASSKSLRGNLMSSINLGVFDVSNIAVSFFYCLHVQRNLYIMVTGHLSITARWQSPNGVYSMYYSLC